MLVAWAVLFLSGAALMQMLAGATFIKLERARSESQKLKGIEAWKRQGLKSLNALNEWEAAVLLECLRSNEQTFCRVHTDAIAMSLANKGIVEARTQGHPLDMPFTISTEIWSHLMEDKDGWLQSLSEKCQPKSTRRRR